MLQPVQARFKRADYPALLVGLDAPDDAAVYDIGGGRAIVQTVDFFPPVVDDPYWYGAIAAANAISDIYAMGAEPLFALNILAIPEDFPADVTAAIMRGGADKAAEAGAPIAGGHTVRDAEPKYGLAVTGMIDPARLLTKGGAQPGDVLVLTKPLGVGVITTAHKRDSVASSQLDAAIASMATLNRAASTAARAAGARSMTDITGFGLIGHALEMAQQSGVRLEFSWDALPFLPGALQLGKAWVFPGGAASNQEMMAPRVAWNAGIVDWQRMMLYDPETSGGMLVPLAPARVAGFMAAMQAAGESAWQVGTVREGAGVAVLRAA